jgi:D-alanyl-D-alanine carboxypeptidase (penicillin-binding protein 5/6)
MILLALMLTLALHWSGAWPHLSAPARAEFTAAADTGSLHLPPPAATAQNEAIPVPVAATPLQVDAAAATAVDLDSGTVLFSQNAGTKRPIASITKLATSLVALSRHKPSDELTIPTLPAYDPADELIGLRPGENYTTGDLVRAALINSGDDAADALAIADAGSSDKFVGDMNSKMTAWGITGTHFSNASGLQDKDNYSTASSVAKIAELALSSQLIRSAVAQSDATITSQSGRAIELKTTNDLLASGQFYGIKTGYTPAAGECFVGLTRINGHEVVTVVLGAGDRFAATSTLVNWISHNWQWL